jgi:hypothetical protein
MIRNCASSLSVFIRDLKRIIKSFVWTAGSVARSVACLVLLVLARSMAGVVADRASKFRLDL